MISTGKLEVESLITHRFNIDNAARAYKLITRKTGEPFLGVLLTYPAHSEKPGSSVAIPLSRPATPSMDLHLGVLGAGNYAQAVFLPVIKKPVKLT